MSTPVVEENYLYGICGYGQLRCLDARTGERIWESQALTDEAGGNGDVRAGEFPDEASSCTVFRINAGHVAWAGEPDRVAVRWRDETGPDKVSSALLMCGIGASASRAAARRCDRRPEP